MRLTIILSSIIFGIAFLFIGLIFLIWADPLNLFSDPEPKLWEEGYWDCIKWSEVNCPKDANEVSRNNNFVTCEKPVTVPICESVNPYTFECDAWIEGANAFLGWRIDAECTKEIWARG